MLPTSWFQIILWLECARQDEQRGKWSFYTLRHMFGSPTGEILLLIIKLIQYLLSMFAKGESCRRKSWQRHYFRNRTNRHCWAILSYCKHRSSANCYLCYPVTYMPTFPPLNILSKGELNCCDWTSGFLLFFLIKQQNPSPELRSLTLVSKAGDE